MGDSIFLCPLLSIPAQDEDRALVTILAHTTTPRNSRFEVKIKVQFLRLGVFDAQNLVTIPQVKLIRKLGVLPDQHLTAIENAVRLWLGL
jgi:mRNA interferase MazF